MTKIIFFLVFLCVLIVPVWAYQLSGTVTDSLGNPIPYAEISVKGSSQGVSTNKKGIYYLNLSKGIYNLEFTALGFTPLQKKVEIKDQNEILDVTLLYASFLLEEFVVQENREDPAYQIIRNAIKNKEKNNFKAPTYRCEVYLKSSLEKEFLKPKDSLETDLVEKSNIKIKERMNFYESYSTLYVQKPNKMKQVMHAVRDISDKSSINSESIQIGLDIGDPDKKSQEKVDLNLFKTNLSQAEFNFYESLIDIPVLTLAPLISPMHPMSTWSYTFSLEEYFFEDGVWLHKIKVNPKNSSGALFKGTMYIVDSTWAIKALDFEVNTKVLQHFKYFKIAQNYTENDSVFLLNTEEFIYDTQEGKETILGNTKISYSNYTLNERKPTTFFGQELSVIEDQAYEKDSLFWIKTRTFDLYNEEKMFINTIDSVNKAQSSSAYLLRQDSIENKLKWWKICFGVNYQNSITKEHIFIQGLVSNAIMGAFGIGGYRQRLEAYYRKEFKKGYKLDLNGLLNYGFTNKDLKGHLSASYTYLPKKFGRIHGSYLNEYGFINGYQSISNTFSNGNYVNDIGYSFGNEIEVINGLYVDVTLEYIQKKSIENLKRSAWSEKLFGQNNQSTSFADFDKFALEFDIKYIPFQKYATEPYKKINLGSEYPTFGLKYRKGIPGVIQSISNYDFIEIRAWDQIPFGSLGESKWKVYVGKFLNSSSLVFTENKFFRQSDQGFFSDPLRSFQLLDTSLNTTQKYIQCHYLHRFNGFFLRKIPLVKKLGLLEVAGAGALWIDDQNFTHYEVYGGLEKPININAWKLRFKIGAYYVVSYGNYFPFQQSIKFGIDFFDPFTSSWGY